MKKIKRFYPFILTLCLVVLDQITKSLVIKYIPLNTVAAEIGGDFLWICHVRNTGAAFSFGASGSSFFRIILFIVLPIALMIGLSFMVASKKDYLTKAQKWFVAGIIGGGIGTLIDRIFRFDEGVVDFISVKFYGLFGLERWPTFNVSDSCVVIFVILFAISVLFCKEENK
ncbi:MAG: signal peptidase II [Sphaerochaetaceae bacterium]|nr:signal peptidase II [Sphaerochaetaceae bacterium]